MIRFRRRSDAALQAQLEDIERRAASEALHIRARLYNQAGDLCSRAGETPGAKVYYGRAIDAYIEAGSFAAAAALCRKVIRVAPGVIRARATLALLYLGKKVVETADYEVQLVQDYIEAARREGDDQLLIHRLRVMADATENQELRVLIGQRLIELGDDDAGRQILHSIYLEINDLVPLPEMDPGEQWDRLLRAALMTPKDLLTYEAEEVTG